MVLGIDAYDTINYFTRVNLHILLASAVFCSSIPAVIIINCLRGTKNIIIDDASLVPPSNSKPTVIIDELNIYSK